jgi:hypothetical protein
MQQKNHPVEFVDQDRRYLDKNPPAISKLTHYLTAPLLASSAVRA